MTAALFSVGFFAAGNWEKDTKNEAAVTSIRSYLFCDDFRHLYKVIAESVERWVQKNLKAAVLTFYIFLSIDNSMAHLCDLIVNWILEAKPFIHFLILKTKHNLDFSIIEVVNFDGSLTYSVPGIFCLHYQGACENFG